MVQHRPRQRSGFLFMAARVKEPDPQERVRFSLPRAGILVHSATADSDKRSCVSTTILPCFGLWPDVLHLWSLLSGSGLLQRGMPSSKPSGTTAESQPPISAGS